MIRPTALLSLVSFSVFVAACGGAVSRDVPSDPPAQPPGSSTSGGADPGASGSTGNGSGATAGETCVTLVGSPSRLAIATVDLARGTVDVGPQIGLASSSTPDVTSLGVVGDEVVFCASHSDGSGTGAVVRASRTDGSAKVIAMSCDAVTATAEGIWVLSMYDRTISRYASLDALAAKKPAETREAPTASRLGPSSEGVLSAWHSTNEIDRVNASGISPLKLEGFDGWVYGVSALPNGNIVVSSPRGLGGMGGLVMFDANGKNQGVVVKAPGSGLGFSGLSCMPSGG